MKNNLKKLRKAKGWSQQRVAMSIPGMTRERLKSYENGYTRIPLCQAAKLAAFYRVTIDELVY